MSIGQLFALHRSSYSAWSPLTLEPVYRASFGRIWSLRGVSATPISSWSSRRWTLREAFIRRHTHGVSSYVWISLKSKYSARWRAGSKIKSGVVERRCCFLAPSPLPTALGYLCCVLCVSSRLSSLFLCLGMVGGAQTFLGNSRAQARTRRGFFEPGVLPTRITAKRRVSFW